MPSDFGRTIKVKCSSCFAWQLGACRPVLIDTARRQQGLRPDEVAAYAPIELRPLGIGWPARLAGAYPPEWLGAQQARHGRQRQSRSTALDHRPAVDAIHAEIPRVNRWPRVPSR